MYQISSYEVNWPQYIYYELHCECVEISLIVPDCSLHINSHNKFEIEELRLTINFERVFHLQTSTTVLTMHVVMVDRV